MNFDPMMRWRWIIGGLFAFQILESRSALAQVVPDGTMNTPDPGSCVVQCTITGGTADATRTNLSTVLKNFPCLPAAVSISIAEK